MNPVNWKTTPEERRLIKGIAHRAHDLTGRALTDWIMDITATHCNGMPLDLPKLLTFDTPNFVHDICGIEEHLDRTTGTLTDCFVPRCALPERTNP